MQSMDDAASNCSPQAQNASSKDEVCLRHEICEFLHRKWVKGISLPFLEGHDQHLAAFSRWDRDRSGTDAAHPGLAAGLNFLQRFVVINELGLLNQVENKFGVPVWQEAIHLMDGVESIIIDKGIDVLAEGESGCVDS